MDYHRQRVIVLFNRNLPTRCHKTSLRAFISWIAGMDVVCIFNRGSNRGWADIQGKALSPFSKLLLIRNIFNKRLRLSSPYSIFIGEGRPKCYNYDFPLMVIPISTV